MNELIKEAIEKEAARLESTVISDRLSKLKIQVIQIQEEIQTLEDSDKANNDKIKILKDYIK